MLPYDIDSDCALFPMQYWIIHWFGFVCIGVYIFRIISYHIQFYTISVYWCIRTVFYRYCVCFLFQFLLQHGFCFSRRFEFEIIQCDCRLMQVFFVYCYWRDHLVLSSRTNFRATNQSVVCFINKNKWDFSLLPAPNLTQWSFLLRKENKSERWKKNLIFMLCRFTWRNRNKSNGGDEM